MGYNQTQPIIKIEGVTYAELVSKLGLPINGLFKPDIVTKSNADVDIPTEQALLSALDVLEIMQHYRSSNHYLYLRSINWYVTSITSVRCT